MRPASFSPGDIKRVQYAALLLEQNMHTPITIAALAITVELSSSQLKKAFKYYYGIAPYGYLLNLRMKKAKSLLLEEQSNKAIASLLGYRTESNFCKAFRVAFNESPKSWMKKRKQSYKLLVS
jgi:AraC-like DNA-binding protein